MPGLILKRHVGEKVHIGLPGQDSPTSCTITILGIIPTAVRLAFEADREVEIVRDNAHETTQSE